MATIEDATAAIMTPGTTNLFVRSVQIGSAQSNGVTQEATSILKGCPTYLTAQHVLFGTFRGLELASDDPEDQNRPDRAVFYLR